jgi:hypothetical protein
MSNTLKLQALRGREELLGDGHHGGGAGRGSGEVQQQLGSIIEGIGNRFIKKFWSFFRIPLLEYISVCNNRGTLTETFRTALIRLIPKKGDVSHIKNWRPISLLSCFYKIVSKAVDARLEKVIDKVTLLAQKAYNKKRYIQEALINTIDTIRHCEQNGINGVILSIDQKRPSIAFFIHI